MASGNTLIVITPACNEPPSSAYATPDVRNLHPVLDFDDTASESAVFSAVLPRHYAGGGITVTIAWMATSATLTWTEAGDANNKLANWYFSGPSAANTDQWTLYWSYVAPSSFPGTGTVSVYKVAGKAAGDKVAEGSGTVPAGSGAVTIPLFPQNFSELSGSVDVAFEAATDNDSGNTLTANRVKWTVAFERLAENDQDLDGDGFAAQESIYSAPAGDSGMLRYTQIALTHGAQIDNLAAGEAFRLKLTRDSNDAGDVMSGDAELARIELRET